MALRLGSLNARALGYVRALRELTAREKEFLLAEILQVKGLMPLLMKPRNRQRWSPEDKREIARHLRRLSRISPYLVVLAMPGGLVLLPLLAWWLDRRRGRARASPSVPR
jgi:hypothetical protein